MKEEFLMGQNTADGLKREVVRGVADTSLTPGLRERLYGSAVEYALAYYRDELPGEQPAVDARVVSTIVADIENASRKGLFRAGGIREDDYVCLRALAEIIQPATYVESGVFIGSSLHAFHSCESVRSVYAIDPDLSNLKFRDAIPGRTAYVDGQDFSEISFESVHTDALVYFDDHISTTMRIQQAHAKGFRTLVFDDSTGFRGITQSVWPATPTVGMLLQLDRLRAGDRLTWYLDRAKRRGLRAALKSWREGSVMRITLEITQAMLVEMSSVKALIRKIVPLPDLALMMPLRDSHPLQDRTKYLVLLHP